MENTENAEVSESVKVSDDSTPKTQETRPENPPVSLPAKSPLVRAIKDGKNNTIKVMLINPPPAKTASTTATTPPSNIAIIATLEKLPENELNSSPSQTLTTTVAKAPVDDRNPLTTVWRKKRKRQDILEVNVNRTRLAELLLNHRARSQQLPASSADKVASNLFKKVLSSNESKIDAASFMNMTEASIRKSIGKNKVYIPITDEINELIEEVCKIPLSELTGENDETEQENQPKTTAAPPRIEYSVEHYMAAIMFWKLSKHKIVDFENTSCRKNSDKPMKTYRYEHVVEKFHEQYGFEPPSYGSLQAKIKDFKEKKPVMSWTGKLVKAIIDSLLTFFNINFTLEKILKKVEVEPEQASRIHNYVKDLPPNKPISQCHVSKVTLRVIFKKFYRGLFPH